MTALALPRSAIGLLVVVVLGCGASQPTPTAPTEPAPPEASSTPIVAPSTTTDAPAAPANVALPAAFTCDGGPGPTIKPVAPNPAPPPVAGQMTEQAAQAKRLFDSEKWNEANSALRRVANGETGDDEGNKQLADYHAAIALARMKRDTEASAAFRTIASKSNHLKHSETLLWLVRIAEQHPEHLTPIDFATYTIDQVDRFHNPNQEGIYQAASFFVGRERLAEGKRDQAKLLLDHVAPNHPYAAAAKKCSALAK